MYYSWIAYCLLYIDTYIQVIVILFKLIIKNSKFLGMVYVNVIKYKISVKYKITIVTK